QRVPGERQNSQRVKPRTNIIHNHPETALQAFEAANWEGLRNIKQAKEAKSENNVECRKAISTGSHSERDHLTNDFIDHNALSIVSPQMLDARRSPDTDDEEKNYSMRIISASARAIQQEINEDAYNRACRAGRFRRESCAAGRGNSDRDPGGCAERLTLRLHDPH